MVCRRRGFEIRAEVLTLSPDTMEADARSNPSEQSAPAEISSQTSISDGALPASPSSSVPSGQKPTLRASDVHHGFVPTHTVDEGISSWSSSSDKQLSQIGSPGTRESVFPIRSVVSVDPSQTPSILQQARKSSDGDYFPSTTGTNVTTPQKPRTHQNSDEGAKPTPRIRRQPEQYHTLTQQRRDRASSSSATQNEFTRYGASNRLQLFRDDGSDKSVGRGDAASRASTNSMASRSTDDRADRESLNGLITARFKHMVTEEGHAIITGRDGDILQRCEDEPIHIPGAVQGFGLLIALEEKENGQLIVRVVSENSHRMIGYHPQELFKLNSFADILSEEQQDNLLDHVDFIRDEDADVSLNGPEVFTISIRPPKASRRSRKLWCAMHINPKHPDLIICEFELDDDQNHPLVPPDDETPEPPEDTLHSEPTDEELAESTNVMSKPLRVLRSARKRKGEAAAMEVFNIMSQVQEQLASAPNLETFLKILVGVVKELTGFHRVMIYQFDTQFNGRVVTELVDPRATKDLYKGLNFPASDIPKQARDLYKINKVRLLYDRDLETARLVCRSIEDLETPLDLSYSYLRAMSPIHIKYLANMAVRSSMSISINAFNELWGLIACHSYGSKGMRVSFPIRKMCRLVGDTASRNIERLSYASRLQARKLINTVPTEANPSGYIIASSDDLLTLFDADFGLLSIHGETKILGKLEQTQEALAMLEYLRLRKISSVVTSQDISQDFPDLRYSPGFNVLAGLLLVPLSVGGTDFITFFRRGVVREVKWAGNPYEKFIKEGTEGYLEPRTSFKAWSETVVGKCREWTEEQIETAAVLCLVYGKFIEVWRQKEAALQSSQFTKLLLANSAHEVRTPLNAIINYLEIALEGALDQETRDNLAKSHSASKSLIYVINDLLDLTKTEEGKDLIKDEVFDLPATIKEASDSFKGDAKRKELEFELIEHPGLPRLVYGDQQRIRQAISNIIGNAIQHTASGWIHIEAWTQEVIDRKATVEIVIQDSGPGMSNEKLDALFRDLEQVTTDEQEKDTPQDSDHLVFAGKESQSRALGLGLAMVARLVRNMDGQLRLKSEEGKGTRFVIQLPFVLSDDDAHAPGDENKTRSTMLKLTSTSPLPSPQPSEGEVTLIEKGSSIRSEGVSRKRGNAEEVSSLHSFKSNSSNKSNKSNRSAKSDVDRLIDAISGPLAVGEPESENSGPHRSNSKGSGHSRKSAASLSMLPATRASTSPSETPGILQRSRSYGGPQERHHSPTKAPIGSEYVTDNKTPIKAVRMPDEFGENPSADVPPHIASRVLFDIPRKSGESAAMKFEVLDAEHLQVLVAEDDPVNSKIIEKRMVKSGHEVYHTVNGEQCASAYGDKPAFFDVILMDMQMPIVDGLTSTKMIRSFEKTQSGSTLSRRAELNGRVPIFAVSASLVERERQTYINAGFDGWILKPIDFKRLNTLLSGIVDDEARNTCLYKQGEWEQGGWFQRRQPSTSHAETSPSRKSPVQNLLQHNLEPKQPDRDSAHSSESGSITPISDNRRQFVFDERRDSPKEVQSEGRTSATASLVYEHQAENATNDSEP